MKGSVFVVGGYIPNGGTYMAYHLALIFYRHFGCPVFVVAVDDYNAPIEMFDYPIPFERINLASMKSIATKADILIANPSYSDHGFGNWFPGLKLMYVQGVTTFTDLDCGFDKYVCVSRFVAEFIAGRYGIKAAVVPAFVDIPRSLEVSPWRERPPLSVLVHAKQRNGLQDGLKARVVDELQKRIPGIKFEPVMSGKAMTHGEMMERLASRRYLLTLAITEGFGLVPLEAMAAGTTVLGFDGFGGREYMEPGVNCHVAGYPDVAGLIDAAEIALKDDRLAERSASNGRATAARFTHDQFEKSWIDEIGPFLGKT